MTSSSAVSRPRIAVFAGPNATILNSEPLVTSNKARDKYALPPLTRPDGQPRRVDVLRPQRLAAPVTVYVEQFSAHPLERDAAELYAPPDGYVDLTGVFHAERQGPDDVPVYEVTLRPEDGLYPLPYMARQASGQPWEDDGAHPFAPAELCRQPFYPDASRVFEEIDRLGYADAGLGGLLSDKADFDFFRASPPGGYKQGLVEADRTDAGVGAIPPERLGHDFFPYRPNHLLQLPAKSALAEVVNSAQRALDSGAYAGLLWLEGSPTVEETAYWLSLLLDTRLPIGVCASQRPHGALGNDGDRNIVDAVEYIASRIWADEAGGDRVGAVLLSDKRVFTAREVQKVDARPGGYAATGGTGGIVATLGEPGPPTLLFVPTRRHTALSAVNVRQLPSQTMGVRLEAGRIATMPVPIKDSGGVLLPTAIPSVRIVKVGHALSEDLSDDPAHEPDISSRVKYCLHAAPLAGFVGEGMAPYGVMTEAQDAALSRAVFSGLPVVNVGRGNTEGMTYIRPPFIGGSNLTATKARLLLMACLMKFGAPPPAADPTSPTPSEVQATMAHMAAYQAVFDTH